VRIAWFERDRALEQPQRLFIVRPEGTGDGAAFPRARIHKPRGFPAACVARGPASQPRYGPAGLRQSTTSPRPGWRSAQMWPSVVAPEAKSVRLASSGLAQRAAATQDTLRITARSLSRLTVAGAVGLSQDGSKLMGPWIALGALDEQLRGALEVGDHQRALGARHGRCVAVHPMAQLPHEVEACAHPVRDQERRPHSSPSELIGRGRCAFRFGAQSPMRSDSILGRWPRSRMSSPASSSIRSARSRLWRIHALISYPPSFRDVG
jgi:hypothetical protein